MNSHTMKWLVTALIFSLGLSPLSGGTLEKEFPEDLEVISISGYPRSTGTETHLISVPIADAATSEKILTFLGEQDLQKAASKVTHVPVGGGRLTWVVTGLSQGIPFVINVNANMVILSDGTLFRGELGRQLYVDFSRHLESLKVIPDAGEVPALEPAK